MGLFDFLFNNELQNVSEFGTDEIEPKYKNSKEYQKEIYSNYEYFCDDNEAE